MIRCQRKGVNAVSLFQRAGNLDVQTWIRGLLGAAISGGSSTVASAIVLPSLDSDQFNIFKWHFYVAVIALGTTSALVSVAKFLSAAPLPALKTETAADNSKGGVSLP